MAPKLSADPKPTRLTPENEPAGEPDHFGPAVEPVAAPSTVHAVAAQQTESPSLAEIPTLISTNTITSCSIHERNSQPTLLSGRLDSAELSEESAQAAPNDAVSSLPQHVSSLLAALHVLNSKPSPPPLEEKSSRLALASQLDEAAMSVETIADPPDAESAFSQSPKSLMPEMPALVSIDTKSSAPIFEEGRGRPLFSDRAPNEVPTATAVASSADMESAVTRVQQAKSLLDQLDLNTAIQLRWTMRDIRSKRTKFAPVSADDLKALVNLGFVEMRDGLPRLTTVGLIALD